MKAAIICIFGLVVSWVHAGAEPLLEGRVRLDSGAPVPGAQVLLFDLADLRAAPLAATTDRSGHFTLPLTPLGAALPERFELGANYPNPFNCVAAVLPPPDCPSGRRRRVEDTRHPLTLLTLPRHPAVVADGEYTLYPPVCLNGEWG